MDNRDYGVGYMAEADEQWISCVLFFPPLFPTNVLTTEREKSFFAKEYRGPKEQTKRQSRERNMKQASSYVYSPFSL